MTSGSLIELPVDASAAIGDGVIEFEMVASTATDSEVLAEADALGSDGGLTAALVLELAEALALTELEVLGGGGGFTAVLVAGAVDPLVVGVGVADALVGAVGLDDARHDPLSGTEPVMVRVSGLGPVHTTCS